MTRNCYKAMRKLAASQANRPLYSQISDSLRRNIRSIKQLNIPNLGPTFRAAVPQQISGPYEFGRNLYNMIRFGRNLYDMSNRVVGGARNPRPNSGSATVMRTGGSAQNPVAPKIQMPAPNMPVEPPVADEDDTYPTPENAWIAYDYEVNTPYSEKPAKPAQNRAKSWVDSKTNQAYTPGVYTTPTTPMSVDDIYQDPEPASAPTPQAKPNTAPTRVATASPKPASATPKSNSPMDNYKNAWFKRYGYTDDERRKYWDKLPDSESGVHDAIMRDRKNAVAQQTRDIVKYNQPKIHTPNAWDVQPLWTPGPKPTPPSAQKPAPSPAPSPVQKPVPYTNQKSAQNPAQKSAPPPVQKPIQKPVQKPAPKPAPVGSGLDMSRFSLAGLGSNSVLDRVPEHLRSPGGYQPGPTKLKEVDINSLF